MIKSNARATNEEWDAMVEIAETAIYFQTREWFEIWSEYAGFENDTRLICFGSGKKVLLPLSKLGFFDGLLKVSFLAPKGMGGFVTNEELDEEEKGELFSILKKMKMLVCAINPYDALSNEFDRYNGLDYTQVLDLSQDFESIFRKWSRNHRRNTKSGLQQGITAEVATKEDDWKSYFAFYQDNLSRWGKQTTNRYGWKLFELMYKKKSPRIKLWLAKYHGQPIAGVICLYHNKRVIDWLGVSSQEYYKHLSATHVLLYYIIKDACQNRFLLYDFMPSSGIEGVIKFKSGFSSEKRPVHVYTSRFMTMASAMRKKWRNNVVYKILMKDKGF